MNKDIIYKLLCSKNEDDTLIAANLMRDWTFNEVAELFSRSKHLTGRRADACYPNSINGNTKNTTRHLKAENWFIHCTSLGEKILVKDIDLFNPSSDNETIKI